MKANEAKSSSTTEAGSGKAIHHAAGYSKALDARKHPIRGLWLRGGSRYYAQLSFEQENGLKKTRRVALFRTDGEPVASVAEATEAMNRLRVQRSDDALPVLRRTPLLADLVTKYLEAQRTGVERGQADEDRATRFKRMTTVNKEGFALKQWVAVLGGVRVDKIQKKHITGFIRRRMGEKYRGRNISNRTINLSVICLRQALKFAMDEGHIKSLPTEGLRPLKTTQTKRTLVTFAEIDRLCAGALEATKNGRQFADYILFMSYSGARMSEALRVRWEDVDFDRKQVIIGAGGVSKNHEARRVDFNPKLETHLRRMKKRRAPDSKWLFPSPQRGEKDIPAKTFYESLALAKAAAKITTFGFHDCRHFFVSFCVMSGIDYMTIASWAGHKDGGVLIGKVYGHLADSHKRAQAARVNFGPAVVKLEAKR